MWLVKTDSTGVEQWNKTYGGLEFEGAHAVIETTDGGYLLAGSTESFGAGGEDMWLVKTDSTGVEQWNKTYGKNGSEGATSVIKTSDGGYLLVGVTISFGEGKGDFWLVKTDSTGIEQWNQTYGGLEPELANSVLETSDGGYVLLGITSSFRADNIDIWLIKMDSSGIEQWNQTYGGSEFDVAYSVIKTVDCGYLLAGRTNSFEEGNTDMWLIKTNSTGVEEWTQTYGGPECDLAYSVIETTDGSYLLTGFTGSFGMGSNDIWLIKVTIPFIKPVNGQTSGFIFISFFSAIIIFSIRQKRKIE